MPDFFNPARLRLQNIFNPLAASQPIDEIPRPMMQQEPDMDMQINQRMSQIYQPNTQASDRLNQLNSMYPTREKPSAMRRIASALTGVGYGPEAGQEVLDRPFNDKLNDWKNQIGPAYQAAQVERSGNVNERTLAYQTIAAELRQRAIDNKDKVDNSKLEIANNRAKVYEYKSKHPDWKQINSKGGTIVFVNPLDPNDMVDTGVSSGTLTDRDRINLESKDDLNEIAARGTEARKTEGVRQTGRESLAERRGWTTANIPDPNDPSRLIGVRINQDTGEVQPITLGGKGVGAVTGKGTGGSGNGKEELPTQTRVRQFNKARQAYNEHPEWQKWIKLDNPGNSDFTIKPPSTSMWNSGPEKDEYTKMYQYIYGTNPTAPTGNTPAIQEPANVMRKTQTNTQTGAKRTLISTDGGKTWNEEKKNAPSATR